MGALAGVAVREIELPDSFIIAQIVPDVASVGIVSFIHVVESITEHGVITSVVFLTLRLNHHGTVGIRVGGDELSETDIDAVDAEQPVFMPVIFKCGTADERKPTFCQEV